MADQAALEARRVAQVRTPLRIGVDIVCPQQLIRRIRLFGATRPDVELRLHIQQQDDVIGDLLEDRLDLAIGWTAPPTGVKSIESAPFADVTLHGVVRADDELATGERLAHRDLAGKRLVMYSPSRETRPFYDFFLACFTDSRGRSPDVTHVPVLDDAQQAILDTVERLGGFTLSVAGEPPAIDGRHLVTRPFEPPIVAQVVVMWRGRSAPVLSPALSRFI